MEFRVTVRDEYGRRQAQKVCKNEADAFEAIRLTGLPKNWFIVIETTEGTPLGEVMMDLKPRSAPIQEQNQ